MLMPRGRRAFAFGLVSLPLLGCKHDPSTLVGAGSTLDQRLADFDRMWRFIADNYPFFADKQTDWEAVRVAMRERVAAAEDAEAFMHALEATLDQLYDPHCMLSINGLDSWRPVPFDVWPQWRGDEVVFVGVRELGPAARAGLRVGDVLVAIDGRAPREAARDRLPAHLQADDPQAWDWALLSAATGRHAAIRIFTIQRGDARIDIEVPPDSLAERDGVQADMLAGEIGFTPVETHGLIGHIRITSFADEATIAAFDAALAQLREADGLLLDVRSNPGGDTIVAVPIMGRFIDRRAPYASMRRRDGAGLGPAWTEYVKPRGRWHYAGPVVVLVDHFSASMAEGFAMGMQGLGRARIVGTPMAGLGAAIGRIELPSLGAAAQCSTEPVYHVDGTPRWQLRPDVEVDPLAHVGEPDPILAAGIAELQRLSAGGG